MHRPCQSPSASVRIITMRPFLLVAVGLIASCRPPAVPTSDDAAGPRSTSLRPRCSRPHRASCSNRAGRPFDRGASITTTTRPDASSRTTGSKNGRRSRRTSREIKKLGANVVRIHLQLGRFMLGAGSAEHSRPRSTRQTARAGRARRALPRSHWPRAVTTRPISRRGTMRSMKPSAGTPRHGSGSRSRGVARIRPRSSVTT